MMLDFSEIQSQFELDISLFSNEIQITADAINVQKSTILFQFGSYFQVEFPSRTIRTQIIEVFFTMDILEIGM